MKKYFFVIVFIVLNGLAYGQYVEGNYILGMNPNHDTSFAVGCTNFAKVYEKYLIVNYVTNRDSLNTFSSFVKKVKFQRKDKYFNVKYQIIYIVGNRNTISVCSDGHDILINERFIKYNKNFLAFLNSIVHN